VVVLLGFSAWDFIGIWDLGFSVLPDLTIQRFNDLTLHALTFRPL
jgi:hypothetical protein